ncbi:hypothetical protein [Pseudarthrobacter sp. NamE2]|uniref:hypothetical protein n=1 Tax=Pseudarthrobacter sp. NamE2 TaxID=2576838 RepID=UPI0014851398|nr:hypothetical protein [Pseudarthrobacter sp. NamE2]
MRKGRRPSYGSDEEMGLDPRWLNNAARAYIPDGQDTEAAEVTIADNLVLRVASQGSS